MADIQKEISLGAQEVARSQKIYKEEEHIAHDARSKANEADDKYVAIYNITEVCRLDI